MSLPAADLPDLRTDHCLSDPKPFPAAAAQFVIWIEMHSLSAYRDDDSRSHIWDLTGVGALDTVILKFRREGAEVEVTGLNEARATLAETKIREITATRCALVRRAVDGDRS